MPPPAAIPAAVANNSQWMVRDWNHYVLWGLILSALVFARMLYQGQEQHALSVYYSVPVVNTTTIISVHVESAGFHFSLFLVAGIVVQWCQMKSDTLAPGVVEYFGLVVWFAAHVINLFLWQVPVNPPLTQWEDMQAIYIPVFLINAVMVHFGGGLFFWSFMNRGFRTLQQRTKNSHWIIARVLYTLQLVIPQCYLLVILSLGAAYIANTDDVYLNPYGFTALVSVMPLALAVIAWLEPVEAVGDTPVYFCTPTKVSVAVASTATPKQPALTWKNYVGLGSHYVTVFVSGMCFMLPYGHLIAYNTQQAFVGDDNLHILISLATGGIAGNAVMAISTGVFAPDRKWDASAYVYTLMVLVQAIATTIWATGVTVQGMMAVAFFLGFSYMSVFMGGFARTFASFSFDTRLLMHMLVLLVGNILFDSVIVPLYIANGEMDYATSLKLVTGVTWAAVPFAFGSLVLVS